jgi:tripartite-type tricarboxylate transporter receptor subunit TctC
MWAAHFICAILVIVSTSLTVSASVWAQDYPAKPIRLVLPFPPGGSLDVTGRILAQLLSERVGRPVVVENRPGASSIIGTEIVMRSPPDGYTLLYTGGSTFTTVPVVFKKLPYDPITSFSPIGFVCKTSIALLAHPSVPASNLKQLVALIKAQPAQLAYGSYGNGTQSHFAGEMFNQIMDVKLIHIPYKGSAFSISDLVAGQIPLSFDTVAASGSHVRAGKIRMIAVTTKERSSIFPDVPTIAESGYPDFDITSWIALAAPSGTAQAILNRLRDEFTTILASKDVIDRFRAIGIEPVRPDGDDFLRRVKAEMRQLSEIARAANIKAE